MAHGFADNAIVQLSAFRIALVHHRPVCADPESLGLSGGIDIGPRNRNSQPYFFLLAKKQFQPGAETALG